MDVAKINGWDMNKQNMSKNSKWAPYNIPTK